MCILRIILIQHLILFRRRYIHECLFLCVTLFCVLYTHVAVDNYQTVPCFRNTNGNWMFRFTGRKECRLCKFEFLILPSLGHSFPSISRPNWIDASKALYLGMKQIQFQKYCVNFFFCIFDTLRYGKDIFCSTTCYEGPEWE